MLECSRYSGAYDFGFRISDVRSRRSEVGGQKSEVRGRCTDPRPRKRMVSFRLLSEPLDHRMERVSKVKRQKSMGSSPCLRFPLSPCHSKRSNKGYREHRPLVSQAEQQRLPGAVVPRPTSHVPKLSGMVYQNNKKDQFTEYQLIN